MIPKTEMKLLRENLAKLYPELAKKDFVETRLCWWVTDWSRRSRLTSG